MSVAQCRISLFTTSNKHLLKNISQTQYFSSTTTNIINQKPRLSWLDLRPSFSSIHLTILERLCLEEALLRHDPLQRFWCIIGTHLPSSHDTTSNTNPLIIPNLNDYNPECAIVMGIGGKPHKLLNIDLVQRHNILVIKRFSGGGTVVVNRNSLWTTFIGRNNDSHPILSAPFPREIMKWSADDIFRPMFVQFGQKQLEKMRASSLLPTFDLVENDYVLRLPNISQTKKMGGNAQTITQKGWLHHTSFLWDYEQQHMNYLTLPEKRPDYRKDRMHDDFLVKLRSYYGTTTTTTTTDGGDEEDDKDAFFDCLKDVTEDVFDVNDVSVDEAYEPTLPVRNILTSHQVILLIIIFNSEKKTSFSPILSLPISKTVLFPISNPEQAEIKLKYINKRSH